MINVVVAAIVDFCVVFSAFFCAVVFWIFPILGWFHLMLSWRFPMIQPEEPVPA
jgi:hypothetical protein